jgi:hypothetical protein
MSHLKHPIRAIREPFGTAGLIVAMIALLAALGGTALAAAKLNGGQKKEVEKIAKKFAGKPGTAGANGATGPAGPAGPTGAAGPAGAAGGAGESVTVTKINPKTAKCSEQGGSEFKVGAAVSTACNGTTGFTSTLPSGKTETGTWQLTAVPPGAGFPLFTSISFPIPLAASVAAEFVETPTQAGSCPGTFQAPQAAAGHLCVYPSSNTMAFTGFNNQETFKGLSAAKFGVLLSFSNEASAEPGFAYGSWAVTAE